MNITIYGSKPIILELYAVKHRALVKKKYEFFRETIIVGDLNKRTGAKQVCGP